MNNFKAGAAKVSLEIPAASMEMYARALYFYDGVAEGALVSVEIPEIKAGELIKQYVFRQTGIKADYIKLASAGCVWKNDEECVNLKESIAQAIILAKHSAEPAKLAFISGKSDINSCSEWVTPAGILKGTAYEGPTDKTLSILKAESETGQTIAFAVSFSVAGEVLTEVKDEDGNSLLTSDLPGEISAFVERAFAKDQAVCAYLSGCCSDQTPIVTGSLNTPSVKDGVWMVEHSVLPYADAMNILHYLGAVQGMDIINTASMICQYERNPEIISEINALKLGNIRITVTDENQDAATGIEMRKTFGSKQLIGSLMTGSLMIRSLNGGKCHE